MSRINYPTTYEKNIAAIKIKEALENLSARDFIDLSYGLLLSEKEKAKIYMEAQSILEKLADRIDYNPEILNEAI